MFMAKTQNATHMQQQWYIHQTQTNIMNQMSKERHHITKIE